MTAPRTGVCSPWATADDLRGPCADAIYPPADITDALQTASNIIYDLTGRQFPGTCSITVRPCCRSCAGLYPYREYSGDVLWMSHACGSRLYEIELNPTPVTSITQVKIDGDVVPAAEYRVDEWRYLVRLTTNFVTNENEGFPSCQRLDAPDTEEDTFSVTYTYGVEPPPGGVRAAAALACQWLLAGVGSDDCVLPQRVQSISRQGESMVILDPLTLFDGGKTGIPEVDLFVASVNPKHIMRRSTVYSVDTSPRTRRAGT